MREVRTQFGIAVGSAIVMMAAGCATSGRTGALAGGGIGALAGQAIGRNTESTLIGAAIGTGIGYIVGNEVDKQHAQDMSEGRQTSGYAHNEVGALGGTRWQLVSLVPKDVTSPYASKFVEFRPQGQVVTTTTNSDGKVTVVEERYRVVGDTLIVNRPGYLINAQFGISGDQLIVSAEQFRAVLKRMQ